MQFFALRPQINWFIFDVCKGVYLYYQISWEVLSKFSHDDNYDIYLYILPMLSGFLSSLWRCITLPCLSSSRCWYLFIHFSSFSHLLAILKKLYLFQTFISIWLRFLYFKCSPIMPNHLFFNSFFSIQYLKLSSNSLLNHSLSIEDYNLSYFLMHTILISFTYTYIFLLQT